MSFPDPLGFSGGWAQSTLGGWCLLIFALIRSRSPWNDRATEPIYPFISRIAVSLRFGGRSETLGLLAMNRADILGFGIVGLARIRR